jgi:hypothetical protein
MINKKESGKRSCGIFRSDIWLSSKPRRVTSKGPGCNCENLAAKGEQIWKAMEIPGRIQGLMLRFGNCYITQFNHAK